jgi:hypothetical protein
MRPAVASGFGLAATGSSDTNTRYVMTRVPGENLGSNVREAR